MLFKALPRLVLGLALLTTACTAQATQQPQGFIRISNSRFVDENCNEYRFSGWNGWGFLAQAVNNPSYITSKFQQAQAASLNMARFFLTGEESSVELLASLGQLDERAAQGLDFILSEAAKYGIKLTLVFVNQWKADGVQQWEKWCGTDSVNIKPDPAIDVRRDAVLNSSERAMTPFTWLSEPKCRDQVKQFYSAVVNRRNTITGTLYRDDPTIFSWNLMNEPRCKYCGPQAVDGWYADLGQYLKSIDPNHLVTTGEEGFYDESDPASVYDPNDGNVWGPRSGQDFRSNHAHAAIDYAVIHLWPDAWRNPPLDVAFGQQWINSHIQVASQLGKPLVLEEFGKGAGQNNISSVRDPWFQMVYAAVDDSLSSGGALRGSLFWQWDGQTGPQLGLGNAIQQSDSTWQNFIKPFSQFIASPKEQVPGCTPRTTASVGLLPSVADNNTTSASTSQPQQNFSQQAAGRKLLLRA